MKKRKHWVAAAVVGLSLLVLGLHQFFVYVLKDQWTERQTAEAAARNAAGLTAVGSAEKSVWDEQSIYWVVTGTDAAGAEQMVWVRFTPDGTPAEGNDAVHTEPASAGMTKEEMLRKIAAELPDAEVKRLLAGAYGGEYAWQLFYQSGERYYYKFYRFSDGSEIGDGYALPVR